MRILLVNKFYEARGGTERVLFDLEQGLIERGHEVGVFAMKTPGQRATSWDRYFVESKDYDGASWTRRLRHAVSSVSDSEARRKMARLLREFSPDVAHLHNIYHQLSPSILAPLRRQGIPVVMTLHDYKLACPAYQLFRKGQPCERCVDSRLPLWPLLLRCQRESWAESFMVGVESTLHRLSRVYESGVDVFVSPSRFLADVMIRRGIGPRQLEVIPNAPRERGQVATAAERSPRPRVLFAGRLSPEKGVSILLAAAAAAREVDLVVAGDGPLAKPLGDTAKRLENVRMVGHLDSESLARERAQAWAVAVPSLWYENAPLTVLEAYAAGRPVLASAHGGLLEMVHAGRTGTLLPPGDVDAWAAAFRALPQQAEQLAKQGERGRQWLDEAFGYGGWLDRHEELYLRLRGSSPPSAASGS